MQTVEWYSPNAIKYSKPQFKWIVREVCGLTTWPSDGKETGYTGSDGKVLGYHAPFEMVKMITGECERRLEKCGVDGLMLEYTILNGDFDDYTYQKLANYMRLDIYETESRIRLALKYCCGFERKRISYAKYVERYS